MAETTSPETEWQTAQKQDLPAHTPLHFDWRDHRDLLDDQELTEDEQREFLETLWSIMVHFVDLGFEMNPLQLLCERIDKNAEGEAADMVSSKDSYSGQFKHAAAGEIISDTAAKEES